MAGRAWGRRLLVATLMASSMLAALSLGTIEQEQRRRRWVREPVTWAHERTSTFLWSKQREIFESVRDHRRTAVKSCHGAGKTRLAATIVAWWIDVHPAGTAFAVTTASTWKQVRVALWRELRSLHAKAKLGGQMNQVEWRIDMGDGHEDLVAIGNKPDDRDSTGFQGIHARYVLVVADEACGVSEAIFEGAEGLLSNNDARILTIGNPTDPNTPFAAQHTPGSGWHSIRISAFDTPNFTGEPVPEDLTHLLVGDQWVADAKRKWGETNPIYIAKVLGEFPDTSDDGLIPIAWVRKAQERNLEADLAVRGLPNELGVDVGGGRDKSVVAHRYGRVVRIRKTTTTPDTMETTGHIIQELRTTKATVAKIDHIGIGRGVVDRGREQAHPFVPINVAAKPTSTLAAERFVNLRAQFWWALRDRFQAGDIDLDEDDDDLAAQLCALKFFTTSGGKIQIESKDDMRKRGLDSPDRADAVMLAFASAGSSTQNLEGGGAGDSLPDRF